jgi:glycosyltransferase involved in cell wall biosynthesis
LKERKPKISVILPCFNRRVSLERSIRSVLHQTYTNYELLVIDDGSTDGSAGVVDCISDKRIKLIRNERNLGAAASRNIGIHAAIGEYVAFQDSDDVWEPEKLAIQLELLKEHQNVNVCICSFSFQKFESVQSVRFASGLLTKNDIMRFLETGGSIGTVLILVKKETLENIGGFDESLRRRQDFDLCLRLARESAFVFSDRPLVMVIHTPGSISDDPVAFEEATSIIIEKQAQHSCNFRRFVATQYAKASRNYRVAGNQARARINAIQSLSSLPTLKGVKEFVLSIICKA